MINLEGVGGDMAEAELGRRQRAAEVVVFLALIISSVVFSFFAIPQERISFRLVAASVILRDVALVGLVLFFVWRNGEALSHIGWRLRGWRKEAGIGVLLFPALFAGAGLLEAGLKRIGLSVPLKPPSFLVYHRPADVFLALALVVVVAISEETIFRGYLILRLGEATRSVSQAIILSAIVFSLGHGYEGTAGVVTVGMMGAVFGWIYVWRRSLVAPIVLHFLQDFVGIVAVPLVRMLHGPG
jgi:membrane protease YdiL (CAAX protease family)